MKFVLFVEGYTENQSLPQFLKKWLDPRVDKPVGIRTVRFDGWPELLKDLSVKAKMYLEGPDKDNIVAVISLLDFTDRPFTPTTSIVVMNGINGVKNILKTR